RRPGKARQRSRPEPDENPNHPPCRYHCGPNASGQRAGDGRPPAGCGKTEVRQPISQTVLGESAAYVAKWVSDPGFSATCQVTSLAKTILPAEGMRDVRGPVSYHTVLGREP